MAEPLRVVDLETGELVLPGQSREVRELRAQVAGLLGDLEALQGENLRLIRANKALKRDRDQERLRHRRRSEVEAIWADWQAVTGQGKRKLSAERFDVIVARLNESYTAEHFHLAAVGCVHNYPWTVKPGQRPLQEVATIASKGCWLESFALAGHEAKR